MKLDVNHPEGTLILRRLDHDYAVYIAVTNQGDIAYIGKSTSGMERIGHSVGKRFEEKKARHISSFTVFTVSPEEQAPNAVTELEGLLIEAHQEWKGERPLLNEQPGQGSPKPDHLPAAVEFLKGLAVGSWLSGEGSADPKS